MTLFYLVRHGVTQSNIEGRHIGQREEELTEEGKEQAQSLAEMLRGEPLNAIYSSPQVRAVATALEIVKYHPTLDVVRDPRLRELELGIFDGLMPEEAKRMYSDAYSKREQDKFGFRIPSGESYADLVVRVRSFVDEIRGLYENGNVGVVGHQGLNRALLSCLLGDAIPKEHVPFLVIPHDAYIRVTKTPTQAEALVISKGVQRGLEERL